LTNLLQFDVNRGKSIYLVLTTDNRSDTTEDNGSLRVSFSLEADKDSYLTIKAIYLCLRTLSQVAFLCFVIMAYMNILKFHSVQLPPMNCRIVLSSGPSGEEKSTFTCGEVITGELQISCQKDIYSFGE
jgi:hypothetical protein